MQSFVGQIIGSYLIWQWKPWVDAGIEHGFIGVSGDFSDRNQPVESERFCREHEVESLLLPTQVHGTNIVDSRVDSLTQCEGDAVLIDMRSSGPRKAYGVRTADCVPLIIRGNSQIAIVHGGWRGLAQGIVQKAVQQVAGNCEVLIGPCAGPLVYEVGGEVIDALGIYATAIQTEQKYLLNLQETAKKILVSVGVAPEKIAIIDLCTISDTRFHSYRRQAGHRGSNLSYVIRPARTLL